MAIDFIMIEKGKVNFRKGRGCGFPDKVRAYLINYKSDYSETLSILLDFDEYDDILLSKNDMHKLVIFCNELLNSIKFVNDYSMYDKLKSCGLRQQDLEKFASEFTELLTYALENNKSIYSVGD